MQGDFPSLTEAEIRSLRRLKRPNWTQAARTPSQTIRSRLSLRSARLLLRRFGTSSTSRVPVLADKFLSRPPLYPRAIVGVGEFEAFCHLPGIGTRWRLVGQIATVPEPRGFCYQILWKVLRPLWPMRLNRDLVIPYPPPPLIEQRKREKLYESWNISPTVAKLLTRL